MAPNSHQHRHTILSDGRPKTLLTATVKPIVTTSACCTSDVSSSAPVVFNATLRQLLNRCQSDRNPRHRGGRDKPHFRPINLFPDNSTKRLMSVKSGEMESNENTKRQMNVHKQNTRQSIHKMIADLGTYTHSQCNSRDSNSVTNTISTQGQNTSKIQTASHGCEVINVTTRPSNGRRMSSADSNPETKGNRKSKIFGSKQPGQRKRSESSIGASSAEIASIYFGKSKWLPSNRKTANCKNETIADSNTCRKRSLTQPLVVIPTEHARRSQVKCTQIEDYFERFSKLSGILAYDHQKQTDNKSNPNNVDDDQESSCLIKQDDPVSPKRNMDSAFQCPSKKSPWNDLNKRHANESVSNNADASTIESGRADRSNNHQSDRVVVERLDQLGPLGQHIQSAEKNTKLCLGGRWYSVRPALKSSFPRRRSLPSEYNHPHYFNSEQRLSLQHVPPIQGLSYQRYASPGTPQSRWTTRDKSNQKVPQRVDAHPKRSTSNNPYDNSTVALPVKHRYDTVQSNYGLLNNAQSFSNNEPIIAKTIMQPNQNPHHREQPQPQLKSAEASNKSSTFSHFCRIQTAVHNSRMHDTVICNSQSLGQNSSTKQSHSSNKTILPKRHHTQSSKSLRLHEKPLLINSIHEKNSQTEDDTSDSSNTLSSGYMSLDRKITGPPKHVNGGRELALSNEKSHKRKNAIGIDEMARHVITTKIDITRAQEPLRESKYRSSQKTKHKRQRLSLPNHGTYFSNKGKGNSDGSIYGSSKITSDHNTLGNKESPISTINHPLSKKSEYPPETNQKNQFKSPWLHAIFRLKNSEQNEIKTLQAPSVSDPSKSETLKKRDDSDCQRKLPEEKQEKEWSLRSMTENKKHGRRSVPAKKSESVFVQPKMKKDWILRKAVARRVTLDACLDEARAWRDERAREVSKRSFNHVPSIFLPYVHLFTHII